jgi:hypothetical protein
VTQTVTLAPGTRLKVGYGQARCRLAGIASDAAGRKIGLSAEHVLALSPDGLIFDEQSSIPIGRRVQLESLLIEPTTSEDDPFSETIGAFEIFEGSEDCAIFVNNRPVIEVANPSELIGQKVLKIDGTKDPAIGTIIGFGGGLLFINPYNGNKRAYRKPLLISFEMNGGDPIVEGEAGSLLVDERGTAAGILISKASDRTYAAPLSPYLARYELSFLIDATDESLTASPADAVEGTSFDQTRLAVQQMQKELASEQAVHRDPEGKEVPKHLLRLLAA